MSLMDVVTEKLQSRSNVNVIQLNSMQEVESWHYTWKRWCDWFGLNRLKKITEELSCFTQPCTESSSTCAPFFFYELKFNYKLYFHNNYSKKLILFQLCFENSSCLSTYMNHIFTLIEGMCFKFYIFPRTRGKQILVTQFPALQCCSGDWACSRLPDMSTVNPLHCKSTLYCKVI